MKIINGYMDELKAAGDTALDGEKAFKLHDTYGFPIDLTREILEESGYSVDIKGFEEAMAQQKKRSQVEQEMEGAGWKEAAADFAFEGETEFTGYDTLVDSSVVKAIFWEQKTLDSVKEGDICRIAMDKTPFYAESGGQIYDTGAIYNDDFTAQVLEVVKFQGVFAHKIKLLSGELRLGDEVTCMPHTPSRNMISANHA